MPVGVITPAADTPTVSCHCGLLKCVAGLVAAGGQARDAFHEGHLIFRGGCIKLVVGVITPAKNLLKRVILVDIPQDAGVIGAGADVPNSLARYAGTGRRIADPIVGIITPTR